MKKTIRIMGLAMTSSWLLAGMMAIPAGAQECATANDQICNEPTIGDATCKAGTDSADCDAAADAGSGGVPDFAATGSLFEAFELAMQTAPSGFLRYDAATPIGDDGIDITGIVVPGGNQDISIDRVTVNSVDRPSLYSGGMPLQLDVEIEGLTLPTDALELDATTAALLGDSVLTDIALAYAVDGSSMTVDQLSVNAAGLAIVGLTMAADGIDPYEMDPSLAVLGMSISHAEITFQDEGVVALLLEQAARLGNTSIEQAAAMLVDEMDLWAIEAASPEARDAYLAFGDFMRAGPHPESTLTITMNPPVPFSPLMLMDIADPDAAAQLLGLSVMHR